LQTARVHWDFDEDFREDRFLSTGMMEGLLI